MAVIITDDDGVSPVTPTPPVFVDNFQVPGFYQRWRVQYTGSAFRGAALIHPQIVESVQNGCEIGGAPMALQIICAGAGGISTQCRCWFVPQVWGPEMLTLKQFSEVRVIADNSTGGLNINRYGPSVFTPFSNLYAGYIVQVTKELGQIALYSGMGFGGVTPDTLLIPGGGTMLFAINDLIRVEVVPSALSNTVTVLRNGVIVGSIVDNAGNRPVSGLPGLAYVFEGSNAASSALRDYRGGPL